MQPESKPMLKVAVYARVSTEEQAEHGYSIEAQLDTLRQYCQLYHRRIVGEYVDRGVSGKEMTKRLELHPLPGLMPVDVPLKVSLLEAVG